MNNVIGKKEAVFVTGGSGFLGSVLINVLLEKGYEVRMLVHKTKSVKKHDLLKIIHGDIRNIDTFQDALSGVTTIYHLAGVVTDWAPFSLYHDVHVLGTKNIINASIKHGVKKIVFVSTIDVLNYKDHHYINESIPYTNSKSGYRSTKIEAEKMLLSYAKKNLILPIIVRPSWIYGEGDTTFLPELIYQIKTNKMVFIGNSKNLLPMVHVSNLVKAMITLGELQKVPSHIFMISDGEISWKELVDRITQSLQLQRSFLTIPYTVAYSLGYIMEKWSLLILPKRRPLLTRSIVEMIGQSVSVDTGHAKKVFGYTNPVSFLKKIDETLADAQTKKSIIKMK